MGYAPIIPAVLCLLVTALLALGSLWLARESRRVRFEEREARRRVAARQGAHERPPSPTDVAIFLRFERAGADAMRRVLRHHAPEGAVPIAELRKAIDPMVDSLRLATHAEAVLPSGEVPPVRSPVEGGLVTCLRVQGRAPLPGLDDPTRREGLAAWLRKLEALEPTKLVSVKLAPAPTTLELGGPELRPLHR